MKCTHLKKIPEFIFKGLKITNEPFGCASLASIPDIDLSKIKVIE